MTTPADKRIAEIAAEGWGGFASCVGAIRAALADPVIIASVRDAALEEAAKVCENEEALNYKPEFRWLAYRCAKAIRDLKTAPPEVPNEPEPAPPLAARSVACPCGSGKKYKRCCGTEAPPVLFPREPRGAPLSLYGNDGGGNEGG